MIDPVQHYSITDQVYDVLKERILQRELKQGERLHLDDLEDQLGVSRTPLKDALNRLSMEGLIQVLPRKGTFVTSITARTLKEVFDVRLLLELYAGELGIQDVKPGQIKRIQDLVQRLEGNIDLDNHTYVDYAQFIATDQELHLFLVELAGNQTLLEIYRSLNVHIQIARGFYTRMDRRVRHTHAEHKQIVCAYQEGNWPMLREALTLHIRSVQELMVQFVQESGKI